jgi:hypothetical protein
MTSRAPGGGAPRLYRGAGCRRSCTRIPAGVRCCAVPFAHWVSQETEEVQWVKESNPDFGHRPHLRPSLLASLHSLSPHLGREGMDPLAAKENPS